VSEALAPEQGIFLYRRNTSLSQVDFAHSGQGMARFYDNVYINSLWDTSTDIYLPETRPLGAPVLGIRCVRLSKQKIS